MSNSNITQQIIVFLFLMNHFVQFDSITEGRFLSDIYFLSNLTWMCNALLDKWCNWDKDNLIKITIKKKYSAPYPEKY